MRLSTRLENACRMLSDGSLVEAAEIFARLIAESPSDPAPRRGLGSALARSGMTTEALAILLPVVAAYPSDAGPRCDVADALARAGRFEAARRAVRGALALDPADAGSHTLSARIELNDGRFPASTVLSRRALRSDPDRVGALIEHGRSLAHMGRPVEALPHLDRATTLDPENAGAHAHRAEVRLALGDLAGGFAEFEWRLRTIPRVFQIRHFPAPMWTGEVHLDETLLLIEEGGFGDSLQFLRFVPRSSSFFRRIVLRCRPELVRLSRTVPGLDEVVSTNDPTPAHDRWAPLLSLPALTRVTLDDLPGRIPYLAPPPEARSFAPSRMGISVGLVWAGGPQLGLPINHRIDSRRSLRFAAFAPLMEIPGIDWISLQKGSPASEREASLLDPLADARDFADTAAVVAELDLVIGVDTAVIHLAGALGIPVWNLSRHDACWRWMVDREDSPWYPTMRIFRQTTPGDWEGVIARVDRELRRLVQPRIDSAPGREPGGGGGTADRPAAS